MPTTQNRMFKKDNKDELKKIAIEPVVGKATTKD